MEFKKILDGELPAYDQLVDNSSEGTIFHKSWWLHSFSEYFGKTHNIEIIGAFENDNLVAALPIPIGNFFQIRYIRNIKLTPYLGPIFMKTKKNKINEFSWKKEINGKFCQFLKQYGLCLYYPFGPSHLDLQPYKWCGFNVDVNYTYILDIRNLDRIWNNMDKKRRTDINNGLKANFEIQYDNLQDFIQLYSETMKRQRHTIIPEKHWEYLFEASKQNHCCKIFTAYKSGKRLASIVIVWDNKRAYYIGGGISENSQSAMSFLIWEAIKYTKTILKLDEFDFEGSDIKTIEFYFRKFGGSIQPFYSIKTNSVTIFMAYGIYRVIKPYFEF